MALGVVSGGSGFSVASSSGRIASIRGSKIMRLIAFSTFSKKGIFLLYLRSVSSSFMRAS